MTNRERALLWLKTQPRLPENDAVSLGRLLDEAEERGRTEEREAAAKACEDLGAEHERCCNPYVAMAEECALRIRSRGEGGTTE